MKLTPEQIDGLMELIGMTQKRELTCDECLELVSTYAENTLSGRPVNDALRLVEQHLELCQECREEYEVLRNALNDLNQSRN